MANNTLGTGVLVLKANANQLEAGLDKAAAKTKHFDKQTAGAGAGFMKMFGAAALGAMAMHMIQSAARAVEELAKQQREVLDLVTDINSKKEAQKLGLLGSDEDIARLEEADKIVSGLDAAWARTKANIISIPAGWLNDASKALGFGGLEVDVAAQEEWKKKQKEAKAEQEALTKAIKDMDAELTKQSATIGMAAGDVKLYDLAIKGVDISKFKARLLANDIKQMEVELKKSITTFGMSADQVRLWELQQRGASAAALKLAQALSEQKEHLDKLKEAESLVAKAPADEMIDKVELLTEKFNRGQIGLDAYARSLEKLRAEYQQLLEVAEPNKVSAPALRAGTRETAEFLINARASIQNAKPLNFAELKDALIRQDERKLALMANILDALRDKPLLRVEEVNLQ
jgi:hypothetical protein